MVAKKTQDTTEITVLEMATGRVGFCILGTTPLYYNAMSEKVKRQLLMPPVKARGAQREAALKHDPMDEFRGSLYQTRTPETSPTRLMVPATMIKAALMTAALDIPGIHKTQIGRLLFVVGDEIPVYGIPTLSMKTVRSADIKKTPDIRTRAVLPEWCALFDVEFRMPMLRSQSVANLLAIAGVTAGIGDWRAQKGAGNYGSFTLAEPSDPRVVELMENCGMDAQDAAIENPGPYDVESEDLYKWYTTEVRRRGFKTA